MLRKMFDPNDMRERIGEDLKKNTSLDALKPVEIYFTKQMRRYDTEYDYDVIANELPYFKTLNYTEYANCFIIHPLQQELRVQQMVDAYTDNIKEPLDYITFFKNNILEGQANKYKDQKNKKQYEKRSSLVALVGSNKLKERICLNKLSWINDIHDEDVYFKAHPLTYHQLIGELKDIFGEENVLPREADLYSFFPDIDILYTSMMSESAIYGIALDKKIEPIDVYHKAEQGSFYHINKFLFTENNPQDWVNKTFSSYKSGIICPQINKDWKKSIDKYLEYIHEVRAKYKNKYIDKVEKK